VYVRYGSYVYSPVSRSNESLRIKVDNRELKEVDHFKFLGSVFTRDVIAQGISS